MTRILYVFIYFCFAPCIIYGQNETNIWYFGENAGLDFNSGLPVPLLDGELNTDEGCASISDGFGSLLFYTDGVTVWNRNHDIMLNGTGLNGDFSSTQSAIIVPKPDNSNIYYIFTVDDLGGNNGLQFSEVDMTLDSSLGGITANKNILLATPTSEKVTAIQNQTGDGYWVISHKWESDEFVAFRVTASGVNTNPIISAIGTYTGGFVGNTLGTIKCSPDGTKLAIAHEGSLNQAQLFDFDSSTGILTNAITLIDEPIDDSIYGVEFSPNSQILYISGIGNAVFQYDLTAGSNTNIVNSQIQLTTLQRPYSAMQLASDGKIYIAKSNQFYLDIIENPNVLGTGCNYLFEELYLGGRKSSFGLPPFIQSFFQIGFEAENVCLGLATQFNSNISQAYDGLLWDFGDGSTSNDENPSHTYSNAGNYNVQLTVTIGNEVSSETKEILVYEQPLVNSPVTLSQCDNDFDGFSLFNLNEVVNEITSNSANEIMTFYESLNEAELGDNPILNLTEYENETVSSDIIWARIENQNGCYRTSEINLVVATTQIPDTFSRAFYQCDDGIDIADGIATFDFSSVDTEVEAMFPSGQQLTINYYRNESDALSEVNPIVDISNYQNIGYPNTQNIFIRVDSTVDNDCLGFGDYITLFVDPRPLIAGPVIIEQCDENNDGTVSFDTSGIAFELLQGQTEAITISYTDELGNDYGSTLPNPITISQPILNIFATMTATNPNNPNGGCSVESTIALVIDNGAVANPVSDFIVCDDNNDGVFAFDTSNIEATILNGQTATTVSYFDENGNSLPSPLPNPFITGTQTITAQVQNELSAFCYSETTFDFVVSAQPIANPVGNDLVCDDLSNDGVHVFTLSEYNSQILNGQSTSIFEISYHDNEIDALDYQNPLSNSLTVNVQSQTIYARIHNSTNPNCFDITSFELGVLYLPVASQPSNLYVCDDESNDGFETFNLTDQNTDILNGQSETENSISFYLSQEDADSSANPLPNNFTNTENPQTIYVKLENIASSECYTTTSFDLVVNEQPVILLEDEIALCEGEILELEANAGYDDYLWSTGETTRSITISEPGPYTLSITNNYGNDSCSVTTTFSVVQSNIASIVDIETVDWSQNNNTITIFVEGNGDYEYSIDGITYQDSNIFTNLSIDEYDVYVRDKNGCGEVTEEIYLLYYPKYFTPNGDGYHDYWQLYSANREPGNKLFIYDRYGKLLSTLKSTDYGWDGLYNGVKLPASDYWFTLQRQNGKQYTGHFSLRY
ncbi:MAG: T9SS type B sorting domain-containing protein [Algicola sp.]|nr:T9SS type B sorting domain-containing protein [Algicola sp.]